MRWKGARGRGVRTSVLYSVLTLHGERDNSKMYAVTTEWCNSVSGVLTTEW